MRVTRYVAGIIAGVTTLTVLAGCAGQQIESLEPKLELRNAAKQLGEAQRAGLTIKVSGSPDDLIAAAKLNAAKSGDPADTISDENVKVLRQLYNSSFTIAFDKAGDGAADDRMMVGATIDGVSGTEVRVVDKTMFVKAPITELATKFGASADEVKAMSGSGSELDPFFDGKWVSIDTSELTDLAESGAGVPAKDLESEKALKEFGTSASNLLEGAQIVRDENDDTHLIVTSTTAKAYAEVKRLGTALGQDLGALGEAPADKPITLDLWVEDGTLTAAEINMLQFVDGATGRVALRVEVTTGAEITAPAEVTKLDADKLLNGPQPYIGPAGDKELSDKDLAELEKMLEGVTPAATA